MSKDAYHQKFIPPHSDGMGVNRKMYSFTNDYSEGAHESILAFLSTINKEQIAGYGDDSYSEKARQLISQKTNCPENAIHFLLGGTQTNTVAIASFLRPHQGVLSAEIGHINTHESGAIEATGHKVLSLSSYDGKINASQIEDYVKSHYDDPTATHAVQPGMVYLSHPTEIGTIYSKKEMEDISEVCKKYHMYLYVDGARLGCALTSRENDLSLSELSSLCDAFYIGGTKNGALFGEALVIMNPLLNKDFQYMQKQKGGRLAKGWLVGVQFLAFFQDNLFFELAENANQRAFYLYEKLKEMGVSFLADCKTNQVFPIFPLSLIEILEKDFSFHRWEKIDDTHYAIRLCTSWATPVEPIDAFLEAVKKNQ